MMERVSPSFRKAVFGLLAVLIDLLATESGDLARSRMAYS